MMITQKLDEKKAELPAWVIFSGKFNGTYQSIHLVSHNRVRKVPPRFRHSKQQKRNQNRML